ncbi:extracellular solute-binding protein, family 5 [Staphylothermus marinus F1]|uniref:Extracellular solute-binding protein, family 5 n=1 Tax=Staphylothermus marinus (strain ATCC 43588 / DSM 3639 / JCM 9404 / F1) TaxID=399550 RepID=A3DLE8_STAMF|nr:ABC transporter substrate-binding protein [Staphylothermus marinus]ABN69458.1 extracellular solute-binding protein, family 5 [Staphylothermus marinus F1]
MYTKRLKALTRTTTAIIIVVIVVIGILAAYFAFQGGGQQTTTTTTPPLTTTTTTPPTTTTTTTTSSTTTTTTTPTGPKALVIETSQAYVVVGPKGSVVPQLPSDKKIIVVSYEVDEAKTKPIENSTGFVDIDPAFYRNYTVDALIIAARKATDPFIRYQIYEAVHKLSNEEVPILWLGQYVLVRNYWDWLHGRYYHPTLAERYDLLWEDPDAPSVQIGIGNYVNDQHTYSIITFGWPDTFDPAADYETFGWEIWHNIGDTLVTYWKTDTEHIVPDLAVAWAHNKNGTEWYFVIRGGVKAFDPWHNVTYDISAVDVLFSIWRIARLQLDPSWMITEFFDVNSSSVLTEDEFNQLLQNGGLVAEYKGQTVEPKSLNELLQLFGYSGDTAGVVKLKLYYPYGAVLSILADPFASVIPMKYFFDNVDELKGKYDQALSDSNNGKNPSAWANYIGVGEQEPTHLYIHQYPVGTGPYYIKEYEENSYIVLEYNPYYWNKTLWNTSPYGENGKPIHERTIYLINDDAVSRIEILKAGQADVGAIPVDRLKDIEGYQFPNSNHKIIVEKGALEPTIVYIVLNANKEPFNNKLVRQALMYAIPFDRIKEDVYAGYLERLYGVIPAGFPGHNDDIVTKYTFDLAKAQQLIQQAGIDPTKYSFEIWYNSGNTQREKIATLLQTYWGQLGFQVTVRALQWGTLLTKTEKGDFDVYIIGWAPDYLDPDDYAGPLFYGGTQFSILEFKVVSSVSEAQQVFSG